MSESKKCAHPACKCMTTDGKKYCSTYCEDAAKTTEIKCGCGHPSCEK